MPLTQPVNQIWICYNHMPGGHMVAMHFEDIERSAKQGDNVKTVKITSKEQVESFKRGPQVMLNVGGKIVKNEVLIYQGQSVVGDPQAADKVIAYALDKGMKPIMPVNSHDKGALPDPGRLGDLEKRVTGLEAGQNEMLDLLKKLQPVGSAK